MIRHHENELESAKKGCVRSSKWQKEPRMRLFVACSVSTLVSRLFVGQWHGLPWGLLGWRVPVSFGRFDNMDYYVLAPRKTHRKRIFNC